MRRRLIGSWMVRLAVALAAAGLLATTANAQSMRFVGSFTLPCEASWGNAVLPAGDYKMTVRSVSSNEFIRIDAAQGSAHAFVPEWITGSKSGDENVLVLTRSGDRCEVRALNLADLDIELTYKPMTREEMAGLQSGEPGRVLALVLIRH